MKKLVIAILLIFGLVSILSAQRIGEFHRELDVGDIAESFDVTLDPSELSGVIRVEADEDNLTLLEVRTGGDEALRWEPGRGRMISTYENIYFLLENFKEILGDPKKLTRPVTITISVMRINNSPSQPAGKGASPQGGFTYANFLGFIEAKK